MADVVGQIQYDARIDTSQLRIDAAKADAAVGGMAGKFDDHSKSSAKSFSFMGAAFKTGAVAAITAGVATVLSSLNDFGKFESSLSQLRYASGATADEMAKFKALTKSLGQDTALVGVTASDAARTMVELSKAGLSVKDTMAASKSVMALAKAGNIEFSEAAVIAASALNAFNLEGKDAHKVADALAAGANASQADLHDLSLGLQQSATVAKQFRLSLNENVTALALFANNGIKGSDAGTSLKTMLISLASPSVKAAGAMRDIGFNAYDAEGRFVGLREMSVRLRESLAGLTDEQKQNALATIFGTDAFRAAAVLADNAGQSFDGMSAAVGRNGAAYEAAKAQLGSYERVVEMVKNTVSTAKLEIGEAFKNAIASLEPVLRMVTGTLTFLKDAIKPLTDYIAQNQTAWNFLKTLLLVVAAIIGGLVIGAFVSLIAIVAAVMGVIQGVIWIFNKVGQAAYDVGFKLGLLVWNFQGFASQVQRAVGMAWGAVSSVFGQMIGAASNLGGSMVSAGRNIVTGLVNGIAGGAGAVVNKIQEICASALGAVKKFFGIKSPSRVMAEMGKYLMQGFGTGIDRGASIAVSSAMKASDDVLGAFGGGVLSPSLSADYGSTGVSNAAGQIVQNNYINNPVDLDVASRQLAYQVARG